MCSEKKQVLQGMPSQLTFSSPSSNAEDFDFSTKCFICAETIQNDFQTQSQDQGMVVHAVKTFSELKNAVLPYLENRRDKNSQEIVERIGMVSDTAAASAKYHRQCVMQLTDSFSKRLKRAHPCKGIDDAMESVYSYIAGSQDCLFKISQLVEQIEGDYWPDLYAVKSHLEEKYGDKIRIFDYQGDDAFVCFRKTACSDLPQTSYQERRASKAEKRLGVVREAAAIILEDIQSLSYENSACPPLEDFMKEVDSVVPESLRVLLSEVVTKQKRSLFDKWERKCTAIAHAIISAVRPGTFFSTLQMGVGSFFYKKFGSRHFIDLLSALGFCSTYNEVAAFESSCVQRRNEELSLFVFNDVDFNINPCNRRASFRAIGEIHYLTSSDSVKRNQTKPCTVSIVDNAQLIARPRQKLLFENLNQIRPISHNILPTINDFMWLYAKSLYIPNMSGWNGFVEERKTDKSFLTSKILCSNSPISSHDTIYNTLVSAVEKCKAVNQSSCVVTFDLHLYTRTHEIINNADSTSPVKHVILRLEGFHFIISFLGSIGYIMAGSGLEHLFGVIFRAKNVNNIMSGNAFSKAIKAHVLTHLVLAKQIINSIELTDDEREEIDSIIGDTERFTVLTPADRIVIRNIAAKFDTESRKIEARGPTAKLWLQYFRMVTLVKQFIEAERSGDWNLHLDTIQRMLPYFHVTGKLLYAKAAHMYIQDMAILHKKLPVHEYEKLTVNGYYMIRRTHRFWSGITSDVSIEQSLIRSMKMGAGLTKGLFDSVVERWTVGLIYLQKICEKVENFCEVSGATRKQNVGTQSSGITGDKNDVKKIDKWLSEHPPFPKGTGLRSISTGIAGDSSINCHLSVDIGSRMIVRLVNLSSHSMTLKRTERVLPLATMTSGIKIDAVLVPIDPLLIFRRLCVAEEAQNDLEAHLMYELAPYPLTLFTDRGMLKGNKSSMYDCFSPLSIDAALRSNMVEVVDGGFLLCRVGWDINVPFSDIGKKYTKYVGDNFRKGATIVFDLFPDNVNNSGPETAERLDEILAANTVINKETICVISQKEFLANKGNKALFIDMLKSELELSGYFVKQTMAHAERLIVHTAIQISPTVTSVVIVSEDVDVLVLLTGLRHQCKNIFFQRPGNGSIPEQLYMPESLKYGQTVRDNILFLHAFSGCNTTSAVYDMKKHKFLSTLQKNGNLLAGVELFNTKAMDPNVIAEAGERFFIALYGGSVSENSINTLRFELFGELANKNKLNPAALPPTKSAVHQHSLRTYHQVQTWLGVDHNPERWGWKKTTHGLQPVQNTMIPVSTTLLRLISCRCRNNCVIDCGCHKSGLKCSIICSNCSGHVCENHPNITDILRDDDNDIDD